MYGMLQPQLDGSDLHNLFSTQDKTLHANLKRNLAAFYSKSGVLSSETNVDKTLNMFIERLDGVSKSDTGVIKMGAWLQYWAFDTIGEINLSEQIGFLSKGFDISNLCAESHSNMRYFGLVSLTLDIPRYVLRNTDGPNTDRRENMVYSYGIVQDQWKKHIVRSSSSPLIRR